MMIIIIIVIVWSMSNVPPLHIHTLLIAAADRRVKAHAGVHSGFRARERRAVSRQA
jgi:hypothetical protein